MISTFGKESSVGFILFYFLVINFSYFQKNNLISDNSNVHISNDLINVRSQARNSFPEQQLTACYTASFLPLCDKSTWQKQPKSGVYCGSPPEGAAGKAWQNTRSWWQDLEVCSYLDSSGSKELRVDIEPGL